MCVVGSRSTHWRSLVSLDVVGGQVEHLGHRYGHVVFRHVLVSTPVKHSTDIGSLVKKTKYIYKQMVKHVIQAEEVVTVYLIL